MLHANNIRVNGGTFVNVTGQATLTSPNSQPSGGGIRKGLDLLRAHASLGSYLNSRERFDPPKCAEETRDEIIHDIMKWINSDHRQTEILWLFGPAGAGKSALAQTLAEHCEELGKHAASNFFSRTAGSERSDGDKLIPTLLLQLIACLPDIRAEIKRTIKKDPTIFEQARKRQIEKLLVKPINKFSFASLLRRLHLRPFARLIVIDGLDECQDQEIQCDILRILASAAPRLPFPFRILITSRPEAHIIPVFRERVFQNVPVKTIDLANDLSIVPSLNRFLRQKFDDIREHHPLGKSLSPTWPSDEDVAFIVNKSAPQFIYASTVAKYVASPYHHPDDRLHVILKVLATPAQDKPYAELDGLYHHIFSEALARTQREQLYAVLGVIYLSTQSTYFHLRQHTTPTGLESLLGLKEGDVILILRPLLSLLGMPDDPKTPIKVYHASLFDFLNDPSRSGLLEFDLGSAHLLVGRTMVRRFRSLLESPEHGKNVMESLINFVMHWNAYFLDGAEGGESSTWPSWSEARIDAALEEFMVLDHFDQKNSKAQPWSFISQLIFHLNGLKAFTTSAPVLHVLNCLMNSIQRRGQLHELVIACNCVSENHESYPAPIAEHFGSILFFGRHRWAAFRQPFAFALRRTLLYTDIITELDIRSMKDAPSWLLLNCRSLRRLSISLLAGQRHHDGPPDAPSSLQDTVNLVYHQLEYLRLCDLYPVTLSRASPLLVSSDLSKLEFLDLEVDNHEMSLDMISPSIHLAYESIKHLRLRRSKWYSTDTSYIYAKNLTVLEELTFDNDIDMTMPRSDQFLLGLDSFRHILTQLSNSHRRKHLRSITLRLIGSDFSSDVHVFPFMTTAEPFLHSLVIEGVLSTFDQLTIVTLVLRGHKSWSLEKKEDGYYVTSQVICNKEL